MVGQWAGLKDGKVLQQVLNKFDLTHEDINVKTAITNLIPKKLAEAKKVHKQATFEYTDNIYGEFVENDYYFPVTIEKEFFDIKLFLQFLEYQDAEDGSVLRKGIAVLSERGYQNELRQLKHDI